MPSSGPASVDSSWIGVPSGAWSRVASIVVVLPASRGIAKKSSERRSRAAAASVAAISGDIVRLATRSARLGSAMATR